MNYLLHSIAGLIILIVSIIEYYLGEITLGNYFIILFLFFIHNILNNK